MTADRQKFSRFIARARRPYRIGVALLSACLVFTAFAMRLGELLTPEAIESAALSALLSNPGGQSVNPVSGVRPEQQPLANNLYEDELFLIEDEAPSTVPDDGVLPIYRLDLSGGGAGGALLLRNTETSFAPDLEALYSAPYPVSGGDGPAVLILHTHGTECYGNGEWYAEDTSFRTTDTERNVVAVGRVLADELNLAGIETLHCTVMHDAEDYNASYDLARASIEGYLAEYPSIRYIIDLHRDAIIRADGSMAAPAIDTPDGRAAQLMLVIGTNALGADHPGWQDNLNVACKLQRELNSEFALARPINLRAASFNEQFRPGSMLLEVGSCGNTLDEAKLAARLFARAFAATLARYEQSKGD